MKRLSVLLPLLTLLTLGWLSGAATAAPAGYAPSPSVTVTPGGADVAVFWRAADGSVDESIGSPATGTWAGPVTLPGTRLAAGGAASAGASPSAATSAPAVTDSRTGLDVFWRGADGGIWETGQTDGGAWLSAPVELPGSAGSASSGPTALAWRVDAEVDVFWRARDGSILQEHTGATLDSWAGPAALPGTAGAAASSPTATVSGTGTGAGADADADAALEVFWRGADGGIWQTNYTDASGWRATPAELHDSAGSATSAPTAISSRAGSELDVFWRSDSGSILQSYARLASAGWTAPATVPGTQGSATSAPAAALSRGGAEVDVFWRGPDGGIWQTGYAEVGGWFAQASESIPTAGALPRSQLDFSPSSSPDGVRSGSFSVLPRSDAPAPTFAATGINLIPDVLAAICRGPLSFPEPAGQCGGGNETPLFAELASGLGLRYGRVSVPYDAIQTSNPQGTGCVNDEASSRWPDTDTPAYQAFYERLLAVQAAGLTPEVVLTVAGNPSDPRYPDPTDPYGNEAYRCGLQGLLIDTANRGFAVHDWEAFNEPDGSGGYFGAGPRVGCGPSFGVGVKLDGAGEAACLWEIAADEDHREGRADEIAAGSFAFYSSEDPALSYVRAYVATLAHDAKLGRTLPEYWALHPYGDVVGGEHCQQIAGPGCATAGASRFTRYLDTLERSYEVWLTEAGDVLDGPGTAGAPNATDGNPAYQAAAAESFLNLPRVSPHVTQEDWYGLQASIGNVWDSGILDANGTPRASYCVLAFGMTVADAASAAGCADPPAAWDWGNPLTPAR